MSRRTTEVLLRHMLDAAQEADEFAAGKSRRDLDDDRQLQHSLIRCIEIIGEAAARIDVEFRSKNPEIPWADIIGMRNRLIHAYFDIELDIVWRTCTDELPALIEQIETLLDK